MNCLCEGNGAPLRFAAEPNLCLLRHGQGCRANQLIVSWSLPDQQQFNSWSSAIQQLIGSNSPADRQQFTSWSSANQQLIVRNSIADRQPMNSWSSAIQQPIVSNSTADRRQFNSWLSAIEQLIVRKSSAAPSIVLSLCVKRCDNITVFSQDTSFIITVCLSSK